MATPQCVLPVPQVAWDHGIRGYARESFFWGGGLSGGPPANPAISNCSDATSPELSLHSNPSFTPSQLERIVTNVFWHGTKTHTPLEQHNHTPTSRLVMVDGDHPPSPFERGGGVLDDPNNILQSAGPIFCSRTRRIVRFVCSQFILVKGHCTVERFKCFPF